MTDLITRLKATPADASAEELRKLSDDGLLMLGWTMDGKRTEGDTWIIWYDHTGQPLALNDDPNPAASMDDGSKLVIDGWGWTAGAFKGKASAALCRPDGSQFEDDCDASTPALALWAAILKAHQS